MRHFLLRWIAAKRQVRINIAGRLLADPQPPNFVAERLRYGRRDMVAFFGDQAKLSDRPPQPNCLAQVRNHRSRCGSSGARNGPASRLQDCCQFTIGGDIYAGTVHRYQISRSIIYDVICRTMDLPVEASARQFANTSEPTQR